MMNRALKIACFTVATVAMLAGCDPTKTANQLTSRTALVGTILATPAIEVKAGAVAGLPSFDGGFNFDGGFSFDAGAFADAGITIPPQTAVTLFVGQLQGTGLDLQPVGITAATTSLVQVGGESTALQEKGGGSYFFLADGGGIYTSNATYEFRASTGGKTYVGEIKNVPALERSEELHPAAGYIQLNALQSFTFNRPPPPSGMERNLAFVVVYTVSQSGLSAPTYTNVPQTPLDFLKLIVAPGDWKAGTVTIPGTAFPLPDTNYAVVLQAVKTGSAKSDNLFPGSALLAGTADIGIVKTAK